MDYCISTDSLVLYSSHHSRFQGRIGPILDIFVDNLTLHLQEERERNAQALYNGGYKLKYIDTKKWCFYKNNNPKIEMNHLPIKKTISSLNSNQFT
jgi:hypothetical protein